MWYNFDVGRIIKILLLILTILYGAYYWAVPALVKLPENFELEGYKISMQHPKIKTGLIPSVKLSAQNVSLLNDDNTKALEIKSPYINIRLLPLVLNKVNIHNFTAAEINADLVLDTDKTLKLGQYKLENGKTTPDLKLNKHLLKNITLVLITKS